MKTYRRHHCERAHRSYRTAARCIWGRRAAWVEGEGPFALFAWCDPLTVLLLPRLERAQKALVELDSSIGCGSSCARDHELVRLSSCLVEGPVRGG